MSLNDIETYKVIDDVNSYYRLESESKGELLLNKYPNAAAAYSLRLLDGYYRDPLIRVRREDGVEVDVYADYNNELSLDSLVTNVSEADDTTTNPEVDNDEYNAAFNLGLQSLGEFVHDDAYDSVNEAVTATVCVWYDQSSNENDAKQAVATKQPKIYDSTGGVVLDEDNNLPAALFAGDYLNSGTVAAAGTATNFAVGNISGGSGNRTLFYTPEILSLFNGTQWRFLTISSQVNYDSSSHVTIGLHYFGANATQGFGALNGGSVTTNNQAAGSGNKIAIGTQSTNDVPFYGYIQECIYYGFDQSTNRQGIEQDINNHYQIEGYTPPEPLIDLTKRLATEAGDPESEGTPAAAYSLRKLSSSYSGPLVRVRRSTDNTEVDVYADDKGAFSLLSKIEDGGDEISTGVTGGSTTKTKLYEFVYGQACDLTVVVWYDQAHAYKSDWYTTSTDQNNATQDATGSQPKIYDSSTGILLINNNKPALSFNSLSRFNLSSTLSSSNQNFFYVTDQSTDLGVYLLNDESNYVRNQLTRYLLHNGSSFYSANISVSSGYSVHSVVNGLGAYQNGVKLADFNNSFTINYNQILRSYSARYYQELIIYPSDQSSNRTGIEKNLNNYYNIF